MPSSHSGLDCMTDWRQKVIHYTTVSSNIRRNHRLIILVTQSTFCHNVGLKDYSFINYKQHDSDSICLCADLK